jgi:hypothetical protein
VLQDLLCKCIECASGCIDDNERLDLLAAQSMNVDEAIMAALDEAGGITAAEVKGLRSVVGEVADKVGLMLALGL